MRVHHLTIAVRGRRALARDERQRRAIVRSLCSRAGSQGVMFSLVDDHLHALIRARKPGYLARDLVQRLRRYRPDLQLKAPHLERVDTRAYTSWLVRYLLEQPQKHGLQVPPALWTGSCFQDLIGARLLTGFDRSLLRDELPRFRLREAFRYVGLEPTQLVPASDDDLRRAGAARIVELAAGVFAAGPSLSNRSRLAHEVRARRLAAVLGISVGLPAQELAHYLGMQTRPVLRLARRSAHPSERSALRLRLALTERAQRDKGLAAA